MNEIISKTSDEISLKELIIKLKEWGTFILKKWKIILLVLMSKTDFDGRLIPTI